MFAMHNTCALHQPPMKHGFDEKAQKKVMVYEEGVDTAYGYRWISNKSFEWILQIEGQSKFMTIGIWGQAGNNEVELKSGPFSSEFDKTKYGYVITGFGEAVHNIIAHTSTDPNILGKSLTEAKAKTNTTTILRKDNLHLNTTIAGVNNNNNNN
ncbi:hypothetical protein RFI_01987 [Reticulomyxa filosa]|uniref:Uncharacterized protein n=1 Tax=Reticulomyxa filosa TaxID=46433 RepID=X6PBN0_RETFI|nr:hypothetical protein RFI_01987 [Reticulomyxa filosa]|eukprot:ETO35087.1 hypothetical protein RFI_01987 [Reticulomyxa filosa]